MMGSVWMQLKICLKWLTVSLELYKRMRCFARCRNDERRGAIIPRKFLSWSNYAPIYNFSKTLNIILKAIWSNCR